MTQRTCSRCHAEKAPTEFHQQTKRPDGLHPWCKDCCRAYNRAYRLRPGAKAQRQAWRRENEHYDRHDRVRYLYGLSPTDYNELLARQGGGCAICGTKEPGGRWDTWHVDHDHTHCSGKRGCAICVRGLLCSRCNLALGHLRHDPAIIKAAVAYVSR